MMVENPERYIPSLAEARADLITVHVEAVRHIHRVVHQIKDAGILAGVALNPATPVSAVEEILPDLDLVLVMSVNPGFGGQSFIESSVEKIAHVRRMLDERGSPVALQVDGGIGPDTAERVVRAGARVLVAGSAVFGSPHGIAGAIDLIRRRRRARIAGECVSPMGDRFNGKAFLYLLLILLTITLGAAFVLDLHLAVGVGVSLVTGLVLAALIASYRYFTSIALALYRSIVRPLAKHAVRSSLKQAMTPMTCTGILDRNGTVHLKVALSDSGGIGEDDLFTYRRQ